MRILIADDHELVRRGLRALLASKSDWEVCGEATNGIEAVEKARELRPDVVVLDITMPQLGGLDAARLILRDAPKAEIVVLSQYDAQQMAPRAREVGARGYICKSDVASQLVQAIEAIERDLRGRASPSQQ
jgi:DNA-binding NarL/FixJ family response regulator